MALLQNEIAPEIILNRYGKWFKKSEKRSETCPKNSKPLSRCLKVVQQHFLKVFHRPKFAQKKFFVTARLCRGSHAKLLTRFEPDSMENPVKIQSKSLESMCFGGWCKLYPARASKVKSG